ncbi:uncharacterized protein METZ01_LOCUS429546 [marine metagenome]|uniref:PilZ domain-containing protein n=1 Tax=marine metagenome TaxID=408172 RepID=A0A382XZY3_9ZZZZ
MISVLFLNIYMANLQRVPMFQEMLNSLETFSLRDLHDFKDRLDLLIKQKSYAEKSSLDKRTSHRARVKISGTAQIEREREFFDKTHKITIHEMSTNGLVLTTPTTVIKGDILIATFRLPSNGEKKIINCKAMRIKENLSDGNTIYEIAARAVDKNEIRAYRDMLKKRGN